MTQTATKSRTDLLKRLDPYWKMEAGNMLLVPLMVLILTKAQIGFVTVVPLLATVLLLGIGAAYWRFKVHQLKSQSVHANAVLGPLAKLQIPSLALTVFGCIVATVGWIFPDNSVGKADRIAATVCAVLAALEYVNYYHRQLQHFDNVADFKRMLSGKGFRQSWMARDLAMWRADRKSV